MSNIVFCTRLFLREICTKRGDWSISIFFDQNFFSKGRVTTQIGVATDLFWHYVGIGRLNQKTKMYTFIAEICWFLSRETFSLLRHDDFRNVHRVIIIVVVAIVRSEYASCRESARGRRRGSGAEWRHFRASSSGRALGHRQLLGECAVHGERRHDEKAVVFLRQ